MNENDMCLTLTFLMTMTCIQVYKRMLRNLVNIGRNRGTNATFLRDGVELMLVTTPRDADYRFLLMSIYIHLKINQQQARHLSIRKSAGHLCSLYYIIVIFYNLYSNLFVQVTVFSCFFYLGQGNLLFIVSKPFCPGDSISLLFYSGQGNTTRDIRWWWSDNTSGSFS